MESFFDRLQYTKTSACLCCRMIEWLKKRWNLLGLRANGLDPHSPVERFACLRLPVCLPVRFESSYNKLLT